MSSGLGKPGLRSGNPGAWAVKVEIGIWKMQLYTRLEDEFGWQADLYQPGIKG